MNVKKYRAATMRDALEQVKSELGEDALVLGSKSLKRRGFLGFGAREMVEVRVSTEFAPTHNNEKPTVKTRKPTFTSLSLNPEQIPATPAREPRNNAVFTALAARAYASESKVHDTYLYLANIGVTPEIARSAVRAVIASGAETRNIHELSHLGLVKTLPSLISFGDDPLAPRASSPMNQPAVALVGPTGVGKTTTIAKLAARVALRERKRVELITLDTYRIAAVEQLKTYAEIIGAGFHVPRSVLELNALVQRFAGEATVLIDTIGRSARDLADQLELADYLRNSEQIVKCLAIQATTHPTDATLAIDKFALFGVDQLVITKLDETGRPGSAISTAAAARLPLAYLCTGQRVPEDIEKASAESLANHALQTKAKAMAA
jgi:flagellar biosynthesis protein FlhF